MTAHPLTSTLIHFIKYLSSVDKLRLTKSLEPLGTFITGETTDKRKKNILWSFRKSFTEKNSLGRSFILQNNTFFFSSLIAITTNKIKAKNFISYTCETDKQINISSLLCSLFCLETDIYQHSNLRLCCKYLRVLFS